MATEDTGQAPITSRCCVCARLRVGDTWHDREEITVSEERVSHTYCPECLKNVKPRRRTSGRAMLVAPIAKSAPS